MNSSLIPRKLLSVVENCRERILSNYIAFEGVPFSGKTTLFREMKKNRDDIVFLPKIKPPMQQPETTINYLNAEFSRTDFIIGNTNNSHWLLSDRSIISTIALAIVKHHLNISNDKLIHINRWLSNKENILRIFIPGQIIYIEISEDVFSKRSSKYGFIKRREQYFNSIEFFTCYRRTYSELIRILLDNNCIVHSYENNINHDYPNKIYSYFNEKVSFL